MTDFDTPPPAEESKLGRDTFRDEIPQEMIDRESKNITEELRQAFLISIMTDAPFEQMFAVGDSMRVFLAAKSSKDIHEGWAWINNKIDDVKATNQYLQLVGEADLGGYLQRIEYKKDGKWETDDLSKLSFKEKMEHIQAFSAPKLGILIEMMMGFVSRIEALRREIVDRGF